MDHLRQVFLDVWHFLPMGLAILLVLRMAGGSRYAPPPHGGPGSDAGMGRAVRRAFKSVVDPRGAEEEARRKRQWY